MWAGIRFNAENVAYFYAVGPTSRFPKAYGVVEPIEVLATEDPEGTYYGWLDRNEHTGQWRESPSMIYERESLFRMCFPYGYKAAEQSGQGRPLRLRIERAARASR